MFPNQMGPPDGQFNPYYNNNNLPPHPQFNQTPYNHTGYGRPTPHHQGMNNLPPPMGPSWNMNLPFPPPPTHQAPQSSTNFTSSIHHHNSTFPYQMNNTNQRNQYQHPGGQHHLPCQPPPGPLQLPVPPNPYGHHPTSQYMMPQMFQGGDMLHQGCAMPGGPQNEIFYNNNLVDQQLRHMQNIHLNLPPGNPTRANQSHHQNFQREKPQQDTGIPQHANIPWRFERPDALPYHHKGNPDPGAREMNQEMYNQWAPAPSPRYECSSHNIEPTSSTHPRSRSTTPSRWTPSKNVLELNTASCFDESSEELAEIFAEKPKRGSSRGTRGSESCSDRSSVRTTSSGYVFYSDDDGFDIFPNVDEEFGSKRVLSEGTINPGRTQDACQKPVSGQENQTLSNDNTSNSYSDNNNSSQGIKPPPGFDPMNQQEQPPADQLQKVGTYIMGLLKLDVTYCHGNSQGKVVASQERRAGRKSKSPNDGPTIRSLIDRPIYNNCESRLMNKKSKGHNKEKAEVSVPSRTSNAIKRINIQKITSHFRVLFEPIPDMFAE